MLDGFQYLISIHAPHARSDSNLLFTFCSPGHFNPRSSCEERHGGVAFKTANRIFQSTLLMRGATPMSFSRDADFPISIHAPHARSDARARRGSCLASYFNPRSSCEERPDLAVRAFEVSEFQSTLLMRGATGTCVTANIYHRDFNPRSSCEERRGSRKVIGQYSRFQSTLLMRGATSAPSHYGRAQPFQSTLLMRGATRRRPGPAEALHHFNPRSSCEERRLFSHGRRRSVD